MISTVEKQYLMSEHNSYKVTYSDGTILSVPVDTKNRHYQEVQDWIADGNSVVDPNAE